MKKRSLIFSISLIQLIIYNVLHFSLLIIFVLDIYLY